MSVDRLRARETGPRSYVGIAVGPTRYALDVRRVREIVRPSSIAALPEGGQGVVGVAYHRGEVVPVVDVRTRLGARADAEGAQPGARRRWVLVRTRDTRLVALVVDEVEGVYASAPREAHAGPPVASVHLRGATLVLELDVDALAAPAMHIAAAPPEGAGP